MFTHTDLDGVGCAIVAMHTFGKDTDIQYCNFPMPGCACGLGALARYKYGTNPIDLDEIENIYHELKRDFSVDDKFLCGFTSGFDNKHKDYHLYKEYKQYQEGWDLGRKAFLAAQKEF